MYNLQFWIFRRFYYSKNGRFSNITNNNDNSKYDKPYANNEQGSSYEMCQTFQSYQ